MLSVLVHRVHSDESEKQEELVAKMSTVDKTMYWYDYETFGIDPKYDRVAQFAGVRTDEDLNIITDPVVIYCQPASDMLPDPNACLVTGISPQLAMSKGVPEAEFIGRINTEFSEPGTCVVGYNNIRFDDEFTRYLLYRNFFDPYAREWMHGNSRWDLIDMVRLTRALRPDGISWPDHSDGKPSFRLEDLTTANGIEHGSAHDALADVYATIELASLIRKNQPRLFDYVYSNRKKKQISDMLDIHNKKPVVHTSSMFPAENCCTSLVVPLAKHPVNTNGVIVYDLRVDPEPLLTLAADKIRDRLFTPADELPEGVERVPLKVVHINKCPVVVPFSTLDKESARRINIDVSLCRKHLEKIQKEESLALKVMDVFGGAENYGAGKEIDPDQALYSGGFFDDGDRASMAHVRSLASEDLASQTFNFNDKRVPEMIFRYRARNWPDTLSSEEQLRWKKYCKKRLTDPEGGGNMTIDRYMGLIADIRNTPGRTDVQLALMLELEEFGKEQLNRLK